MSDALQIGSDGVLTLNLSTIDKPPEEGWHTVEIERADAGKSTNDNLRIFIVSKALDGPNEGESVMWNAMLEGQGLTFTKRFLEAAGYGVDQQMQFESLEALAQSMIGRELRVKVTHKDDAPGGYNINAYAPTESEAEDITW